MMDRAAAAPLTSAFQNLTDPRNVQRITYPLIDLVFITVCAVLSGADDFVSIAAWARTKRKWLKKFLDLGAGIPSHDRFNAVFAAIKPEEFERCLTAWITAVVKLTDGQVIAIDGKTLRRSYDRRSSKAAIHMVSAFATANHVCLGQVATDAKSNEITAIPKLLKLLEIEGCLITIDAMGCQTAIAKQIVEAGADYCLAVKKNQGKTYAAIDEFFSTHLEDDCDSIACRKLVTIEQGHGREEERSYYLAKLPADSPLRTKWPSTKAIGLAHRLSRDAQGRESSETRYYLVSKYVSAKKFAAAVRGH